MKAVKYVGALIAVATLVMSAGASAAFGASEFKTNSGKFPVSFEGKGETAKFESTGKNKVTCEKSKSSGSIESAKKAKVTVTYEGKCKIEGTISGTCHNSAGSEAIKTNELVAEPGEKLGGGSKVGLDFKPASGTVLATFECPDDTTVEVTGSVICESKPIGELETKGEVICKQTSAGVQEFTTIEIEGKTIKDELVAKATVLGIFEETEKDAQTTTEKLTYKEKVEQTS